MKNKYFTYCAGALAIVLIGCTSGQDELLDSIPVENRIAISAGIGGPSVTTRVVNDYSYTTPSNEHPLDAVVWFTDDTSSPTQFANSGTSTSLPRYSYVNFTSGEMTFPTSDVLPYTAGKATHAVGFWPKTGWTATDSNTKAQHTINGTDDLMFANKVTAEADYKFTTLEQLHFNHKLTWLKVRVTASSDEAITAWGKITSIKVASEKTLTVTLNDGSETYSGFVDVAAGDPNTNAISLYDDATGVSLTTSAIELGSAFCAPTATATYKLIVKSKNETSGKIVTVNLKTLNNEAIASTIDATKGKEFIITLTFQPFQMIDAVGKSLTDWTNENIQITGS